MEESLNFVEVILQIKQDVQDIIDSEKEWVLNNPGLGHLVVKK